MFLLLENPSVGLDMIGVFSYLFSRYGHLIFRQKCYHGFLASAKGWNFLAGADRIP